MTEHNDEAITEARRKGRSSSYKPEHCEQLEKAVTDGQSLAAFAGTIGVSRSTISNWMVVHPEFCEAVLRAQARKSALP